MTYLGVAARNLLQARRRTALLGAALALVSMSLVLLLTLAQGLSDTMIRASTLLTSGHVNVAGFYKIKPTSWAPLVTGAAALRAEVRAAVPEASEVLERGRGWGKLVSETRSLQAGLVGIEAAEEGRLLGQLRLADPADYRPRHAPPGAGAAPPGRLADVGAADAIVLFAAQARRLEVGVGDVLTLTAETSGGLSNTTDARVVAVVQDMGLMSNFSAFVSRRLLEGLYRLGPDTTGSIMVFLDDPAAADAVMGRLQGALGGHGHVLMDHLAAPFFTKFEIVAGEDWTGQRLDLTTWEDELGAMTWTLDALDSIAAFLVGVLVLMIVVGITNSMWIAVRERTQEVGTLRAIGMERRRVLLLFLTEALLLGLVATTLGALAGAAVALGVDAWQPRIDIAAVRLILMSDTLHLAVRPWQLVAAVATFTVVTALASLWPSLRAARLQPITAIQRIG